MARNSRVSEILEKSMVRAAKLRAINENLDLGNGLSLEMLTQKMEKVKASLDKYNTLLSTADEVKNVLEADEEELKEAYSQVLIGVAAKYGKNSNEYEQAGGVRKDERKPRSGKPIVSPSK